MAPVKIFSRPKKVGRGLVREGRLCKPSAVFGWKRGKNSDDNSISNLGDENSISKFDEGNERRWKDTAFTDSKKDERPKRTGEKAKGAFKKADSS
ncbi:MAG: hypothetical protein LBR53_04095 [Deltaproteobacteria bacterium]|jgi:hypothetical protein|nr:hypothetical protein [Deltaproteobacteria bacterium]